LNTRRNGVGETGEDEAHIKRSFIVCAFLSLRGLNQEALDGVVIRQR
jgi:hypothetical protein